MENNPLINEFLKYNLKIKKSCHSKIIIAHSHCCLLNSLFFFISNKYHHLFDKFVNFLFIFELLFLEIGILDLHPPFCVLLFIILDVDPITFDVVVVVVDDEEFKLRFNISLYLCLC
jgi:hypothetical protein